MTGISVRVALPITSLVLAMIGTPQVALGASGEDQTPHGAGACRTVPIESVRGIDGQGRVTAHATHTEARLVTYDFNGHPMTATVPPQDWNPISASDEELKRYGFPRRPKRAKSRRAWTTRYARIRHSIVPQMCVTDVTSVPRVRRVPSATALSPFAMNTPLYSDIWNGWVAKPRVSGENMNYAAIEAVEPTFLSNCPSASAYSIWAGVGGWGTGRLLQNGFDNVGGTGPNDDYAWWQAISDLNGNTHEVKITNFSVRAGDSVEASTYYDTVEKAVSFTWLNDTNGDVASLGPLYQITTDDPQPASAFYDPTTAEAITERPSVNGTPINLREPSGNSSVFKYTGVGSDQFSSFLPGWMAAGTPSYTTVTMTSDGTSTGTPVAFPGTLVNQNGKWNALWESCGG
jgi:hypothetical protein